MGDLLLLSEAQMRQIEPYFPLSHGVPRVDDRRLSWGIVAKTFLQYGTACCAKILCFSTWMQTCASSLGTRSVA
jgi:hypothetical protein